jgi:hypothetical protein
MNLKPFNDDGQPQRDPRTDREIAEAIARPTGARCKTHNIPDCTPCKYNENPRPPKPEHEFRSDPTPPPSTSVCEPKGDELRKLQTNIEAQLNIPVKKEKTAHILPYRHSYQPLPRGCVVEWPAHLNGMSTQNIAMFLMMPEFVLIDYEKNKANPPKRIFVTPEESVNRPIHKSPPTISNLDSQQEWSVTHVGAEIIQGAEEFVIHVPAIPAQTRKRKVLPPPELIEALKSAEGPELERLTAKYNEDRGGLSAKELATARRAQYRKIEKLKKEKENYERHLQDVDDPTSGRPAFDVVIPPCPEGSHWRFPKSLIREYILDAFSASSDCNSDYWLFHYTRIENSIIRRAHLLNLIREYPDDSARAQWALDGCPGPTDKAFKPFYGRRPASERDEEDEFLMDALPPAKDIAQGGYRRGEGGVVEDDSIRRVGPGTQGGWHGAGCGADTDERGDSYDYKDRGDQDYVRKWDREEKI